MQLSFAWPPGSMRGWFGPETEFRVRGKGDYPKLDRHYRNIRKDLPHERVNHGEYEYVRGKVHAQTIESFWSLLKQ
jgi:ISXO2-like transposase domain